MNSEKMQIRNPLSWRNFIFCFVFHISIPGCIKAQEVTLDSLEILTKHEWFKLKPTFYFQCKGENKTLLPDVTNTHVLYTFRGQESWQPLTNISGEKCKRCGFYEQGSLVSDNELDEWEFCPSDFSPDQVYVHFKDKEMNATFLCHGCTQFSSVGSKATSRSESQEGPGNETRLVIVIAASIIASTVILIGVITVIRYSQRKKRQQDQARFMKLFEEGDDIEEELGLETVI